MANYLYNGVELPDITPFLQARPDYPYVIIIDWAPVYNLVMFTARPCSEKATSGADMLMVYDTYLFTYKCRTNGSYEWAEEQAIGPTSPYVATGSRVIWTNTDILNEDGSVYLASSDPVPVGGDTTLTEVDFYRPINGAWVKCDAVRKMGNEWVTQDEYRYE